MNHVSRLKRLAQVQQRLRVLQLIELEGQRRVLADAELTHALVLECLDGGSSPEVSWLAARFGAPMRAQRNIQRARELFGVQAGRLLDTSVVAQLATRIHAEALERERIALEAKELVETIDRLGSTRDDSAAQD